MKKKKSDNVISRKDFLKKASGAGVAAFGILFLNCPVDNSNSGSSGGSSTGGASGGTPSGGGTPATDGTLNFEITFNKAMDTASVNDAISISPSVSAYNKADLVWLNADKTVNYSKIGYDKTKPYTITIAGTAKDTGGNFLDGNIDGTGGDAYTFATGS